MMSMGWLVVEVDGLFWVDDGDTNFCGQLWIYRQKLLLIDDQTVVFL